MFSKKLDLPEFCGEFTGRAEGHEFQLRIKREGHLVEATVDWHPEDDYKDDHCRLLGVVESDRVIMHYWRNAAHPNGADHGEAVVFPTADKQVFDGRWFSFDVEGREEDWTLTKTSSQDALVKGAFPQGASIPVSWVALSVKEGGAP